MKPLLRNLVVAGTFSRPKETKEKLMTLIGHADPTPISFQIEPTNPHDAHAVMVFAQVGGDFVHAGYIPATVSAMWAEFLSSPDADHSKLAAAGDVTLVKGQVSLSISVSLLP